MWLKVKKQEKKYSLDEGQTWSSYSPKVFRLGDVIEVNTECN